MTGELRKMCQQLKPIIGEAADSLWAHYQMAEKPPAKLAAENTIRLVALSYLGGNLSGESIRLPPPNQSASSGEIKLGDVLYPGRGSIPLGLHRGELFRHLGVFATTGSGKTNLAFYLLKQFATKCIPFLVVDWKRSYRNLLRVKELEVLEVYTVGRQARPFAWNPMRPPPGIHPQTWIQIITDILEKTHVSGQGVADVIAELTDAEFDARGHYEENKAEGNYPNFFDLRSRLERTKFSGRRALWRDSCLRILRTFTYGPAAEAYNSREPIKLETLLEKQVILELDLELPKTVRSFFSEVILRWIHLYRLGQGETNQLRHVLVLEEAHNIFPKTTDTNPNGGLENIYREIRSFGQGLVAITQHPSMLPIYVLGNTHTLVFMALTHEADIISARQALFLERSDDGFLDKLAVGEGIVKIKGRISACHVRFPRVDVDLGQVSDEELRK